MSFIDAAWAFLGNLLNFVYLFSQKRQIFDLFISLWGKVFEHNFVFTHYLFFFIAELREEAIQKISETSFIFITGQSIMINSHILVVPKPQCIFSPASIFWWCAADSLENFPDISEMEVIVRSIIGCCKFAPGLLIYWYSSLNHLAMNIGNRRTESLVEVSQKLSENVGHCFLSKFSIGHDIKVPY